MNNVFLDCGSNIGQGYEYFNKMYGDSWEYHLFEPNPNCCRVLNERYGERPNVKIFNNAVYTNTDEVEFKFATELCHGGTIVEDHNTAINTNYVHKTKVKCVDIDTYINQLVSEGKTVVLKLDVECAEYAIMDKLIQTGTIFKLSKIYCEYHSMYVRHEDRKAYLDKELHYADFCAKNKISFDSSTHAIPL